mgnify:CR=1 FL=1
MGTVLSLTFEPNGTGHDDLVLRLGAWAHRSDSYYYELDHAVDQSPDAVQSIRRLLTGWLAAVKGCGDGEEVLVPHALFDQCTGWLRCSRRGESFEVVDGWSNIEGWSFYPSDFSETAKEVADLRIEEGFGPPLILSRDHLLADIDASLTALDDEPETPSQGS